VIICQLCKYCTINANYNQSNEHQVSKEFEPKEVIDKTFELKELDLPNNIKIEPIKSLKVKDAIEKVSKNGSFVKNLFLGKFDQDFLTYPNLIQTRTEFIKLLTQSEVIDRYFRIFVQDEKTLSDLGFFKLWKLSITEMMSVFEAIGSSLTIKSEEYDLEEVGILFVFWLCSKF